MHGLGEKSNADGKQFLNSANLLAIKQKQNYMVIRLHHHMAVCDEHLFTTHDGTDGHPGRQVDFVKAPADDL
jgi:hypothetical protein